MKKYLVGIFLAVWLSFGLIAAEPLKIAVIGEPGKHKAEIDLLTEKLSGKVELNILERVDVDYIIKEHAIAASDISKNGIKIGELLGADGVIIFSTVKVKGKEYIYLRLVSVKSGFILDTYAFQADMKSETMKWLAETDRKFTSSFSKLTLKQEDLLPVSILNFRSSSPSTKMINLERVVPKLLTIALSLDKKIIVTERWNSWQIAFEKELANDSSGFKTGNVLLDGEFDEKVGAKGEKLIELSVRINKSDGNKKKMITVSGKRDKLPVLIKELAAKIQKYLTNSSSKVKWDTAAEAKRFYEDAKWAYDFSKFQQAEDAADSAVALGMDTFDLAILRARILAGKYFLISDIIDKGHYTVAFQYTNREILHPEDYIFNICKGLDILSETRRRLLIPNYYDSWKVKENFVKFDNAERAFLVFSPRLLIFSHIAGLHKDLRYADTIKMLQLKTCLLFDSIVARANWNGRRGTYVNDYRYQAYMIFFASGPYWYNNMDEWLAKVDKILSKSRSGKEFYITRAGLTEGRCRFVNYKGKWPLELKGFETDYYGIAIDKLFEKWDKYITELESSNDEGKKFDGFILRDFSFKREDRGKKLLQYIMENIKTAKNPSIEYERCLLAAQFFHGRDLAFYIEVFYIKPEFKKHILSSCIKLITTMKSPPWDIIDKLCSPFTAPHKLSKQEYESIINAVEKFKKENNIRNFKATPNIEYFYMKYAELIKKPAKPKKLITYKALEIQPALKIAELGSKKLKKTEIYAFRQYGDKILLSGVSPRMYRREKGPDGRYLRTSNGFFTLVFDNKHKACELLLMPFEADGTSLFPERRELENFHFTNNELSNVVIGPDDKHHIIYLNRFGDIFAYSKVSEEWRLLDKLALNKVVSVGIYRNILYIAFGSLGGNLEKNRLPTGIIKYNLKTKKRDVIFNNQCLTPRSEIESQRRINIAKMLPVKKGVYFITKNVKQKCSFHFYDAKKDSVKTLFSSQEDTLMLTGTSAESAVLYFHWNYVFQDFKNFKPAINRDEHYYRSSISEKDNKWQWNTGVSYTHGLASFYYGITLSYNRDIIVLGRPNNIYNSYAIHYWRKGNGKSKIIPVNFKSGHEFKKAVELLTALISENKLILLGEPVSRLGGSSGRELGLWSVDLEQVDSYCRNKLDYPNIFPYGWAFYPPKKEVSFWQCLKISMEDMGEGVEVRYTTDGSWPDEKSTLYTKPFVINKSMKIIARAFKKGMYASDPFIVSYTKTKPRGYVIGDFNGDGKDEVLAQVGYFLKSMGNEQGESEITIPFKATRYGTFFVYKTKGEKAPLIAYRRHNRICYANDLKCDKYRTVNYPGDYKKAPFLAGDWDGDGNTEIIFIHKNKMCVDKNNDGKFDETIELEEKMLKVDQYLSGDWNNDGKDDLLARKKNTFIIDTNLDGKGDAEYIASAEKNGGVFLMGDWDGNGKDSLALWRNGKQIQVQNSLTKISNK